MTEPGTGNRPALLVFSDDWGRHPSSCQHLVGRLLDAYRVQWVNTIGTRPPRLDRVTLSRGWGKLRRWLVPRRRPASLPENLEVLNPWMWPWFRRPRDRRINRRLLLRQLAPRIESCPSPVIAVTTLPVVAGLIGELPVARWVYYCVDDWSQWPGMDEGPLLAMEEELVRGADVLIAAGLSLQDRIARWGRAASLLTHGVDPEHWQPAGPAACPPQFEGLERPIVLFWGLVDRRMDVEFVGRLADDMLHGTVVLVGPEADPDPELARRERVVHLPAVPFDELPHLARAADVLVMPYADLPVTRAMEPLKLKEYLATGKPVVVRRLPAAEAWADTLDVVSTAEEFSQAVRLRLAEGLPEDQARARKRLDRESWAAKARGFAELALDLESAEQNAEEPRDAG